MLLNPKTESFDHLDETSRELIKKTIQFFEDRGKERLKKDDHERIWYEDFLNFVKEEKLFATFLTNQPGETGSIRWDTTRNCVINEILGFYGLSYWYTWQVTILGLGPIWMSGNDLVKTKTAELLQQGAIFAFGLSEKEHGADLYSSEMKLTETTSGEYLADGSKYYIGNANKAALVSTFGKFDKSDDDYVFFVVDPQHEKYDLVKNIVNSQNYVAEYKLQSYPVKEEDILSKGRDAWDTSLNTVNVGKFNLGWASIGICTHAYYEALNHASKRNLFNHYVTDFHHIKLIFVDAYVRLIAMKLFASRAIDYMRSASKKDRRYLLFNPMVKMKVTTQGEEVMDLLWDVIAAKGFEKDMYFEMAVRDIRALPKLEGTVHVNMALIIKFMANYFFKPGQFPEIGSVNQPANDDFLFNQGATKGLSRIKFHDYKIAYNSINLPNIKIFKRQIRQLKILLAVARPGKEQIKDFDFLLNLGELFTLVVYGQLIIENTNLCKVDHDLVDQIFDFIIRDFSKFALNLHNKTNSTFLQRKICKRMIQRPAVNTERFEKIMKNYVMSSANIYEMNK
ncbi:MAG: acyl-CoA dehydrogenase [Calditrichaeota bacterium]|nr:MAG: acyl-CoA dehydrogenase [Calditrichota bacterium]MBL1206141.1 acyl-CoA dehydrogenase [Calditrichota bacterium]NOG45966.1 acyl-CoA dehydrogenase [Calditrichota bacterium]